MSNEPVLLQSTDGGVCTLTLNRPDQFNALSEELLEALANALDDAATDKTARVVVLGANGRAFCAGHDLKQMRANDNRDYQHQLFSRCSDVMQKIVAQPQPVIAKVHGMATAAGCQLVASCDLAVSVRQAKFAVSGVRLGLFCSTPAVALTRNLSRKHAMEMLLTGDFIDADTACGYGLINKVCEAEELNDVVNALARNICDKPRRVIELGKRLVYQQNALPLSEAYITATNAISDNMMMDEAREGIDAFIEKRKPRWP